MNLELRRKEIEGRLIEIRGLVDNEADLVKLEALETETTTLKEERSVIDKEKLELRGQQLREKRVIQVSSEEILLPEHIASGLAPVPFAQVSSLVDRVNVINLNGGKTYKKSFVKANDIAGTTLEGQPYSETEPAFGYLTITNVKITVYTEITEELEKLPSIPYQAEGNQNDFTLVTQWFMQMIRTYEIRPLWVDYDPWNSQYWTKEMEELGFNTENDFFNKNSAIFILKILKVMRKKGA